MGLNGVAKQQGSKIEKKKPQMQKKKGLKQKMKRKTRRNPKTLIRTRMMNPRSMETKIQGQKRRKRWQQEETKRPTEWRCEAAGQQDRKKETSNAEEERTQEEDEERSC